MSHIQKKWSSFPMQSNVSLDQSTSLWTLQSTQHGITCWHFVLFFLKEGYWHFVVFKYFLGFSYSHEINSLSGFFFLFLFPAAFIVIIITATATYLLVYNLVIYVFLDMCRTPEQGPSGTYNIWFDIFIYILTFSRVLIINFLFAAFLVTLAFYVLISW